MKKSTIIDKFLEDKCLEIGDYIEVLDNAEDTVWRFGRILHINTEAKTAIIGYGSKSISRDYLLYGLLMPEPLERLKKVGE